jgi:hypothetical protein
MGKISKICRITKITITNDAFCKINGSLVCNTSSYSSKKYVYCFILFRMGSPLSKLGRSHAWFQTFLWSNLLKKNTRIHFFSFALLHWKQFSYIAYLAYGYFGGPFDSHVRLLFFDARVVGGDFSRFERHSYLSSPRVQFNFLYLFMPTKLRRSYDLYSPYDSWITIFMMSDETVVVHWLHC